MTTNIFLQARLNSTRFPKKILKKICNKSILELIIERTHSISNINNIILVTGPKEFNQELIDIAKKTNIDYFCGSEENILDRFYESSLEFKSDSILRITCDNPVFDPNLINSGLEIFSNNNFDILTLDNNSLYPKGMNFEIFSFTFLQRIWKKIYDEFEPKSEFKNRFFSPGTYLNNDFPSKKYHYINNDDPLTFRLTLDYEDDFLFLREIFEELYPKNPFFTLSDITNLLNKRNELLKINEKYV